MGRNVATLDPKVVERSKKLIFETDLTAAQIAKKLKIDRRWIPELRRYHKMVEHDVIEPVNRRVNEPDTVDPDALEAEYTRLINENIPIRERIRTVRSLLNSENETARMRAVEWIDKRTEKERIQKPVPLYQIDASEEPDYNKVDYRREDEIAIWEDGWSIFNPEDGTVSVMIQLGPVQEERAQCVLRALSSGANVGIRGRKEKRTTVDTDDQ